MSRNEEYLSERQMGWRLRRAGMNRRSGNARRVGGILLFATIALGGQCTPPTSCPTTPPVGPPCLAEDSDEQALLNVYKPERLHVINPCLTVTGTIKVAWREQDGDWHLNIALDPDFAGILNDESNIPQGCLLVAEIIPPDQPGFETSDRFTAAGKDVRYIRTTFVPGEEHCMCLFEAANPELVKEVNEAAQIPFTRIVEALDLTPQ